MPDLTVRSPSGDDRALIDEAVARYNRAFDLEDQDELVSVFTENGVWTSPMFGDKVGRKGIGEFFTEFCADDSREDLTRHGQHWVTNQIFDEVSPERVKMWSNFSFYIATATGPQLTVMGRYHDILVKEDGRWLFEHRIIEIVTARDGYV
jgi:uncharacterized protein (TIGR02246 family)